MATAPVQACDKAGPRCLSIVGTFSASTPAPQIAQAQEGLGWLSLGLDNLDQVTWLFQEPCHLASCAVAKAPFTG